MEPRYCIKLSILYNKQPQFFLTSQYKALQLRYDFLTSLKYELVKPHPRANKII